MQNVFLLSKFSLLLALLLPSIAKADQNTITIWSYYQQPPFVTEKGEGLSYDFIDLLNKHAKKRYNFELMLMNRQRLNSLLKKNISGIVLFVNPLWMDDETQDKYLWSSPILQDRNEIISPINKRINYNGVKSLKGLTFGSVSGRIYHGLETSFSTNEVTRYELKNTELVLKMLAAERLDVTSQPRSVAKLLVKKLGIENQLYFSPKPLFQFDRHIMTTKILSTTHTFIEEFIVSLKNNYQWENILKQYNMLPDNELIKVDKRN